MAGKEKEKMTSITTVPDQYLSFATLPILRVSHWSLLLKRYLSVLRFLPGEGDLAAAAHIQGEYPQRPARAQRAGRSGMAYNSLQFICDIHLLCAHLNVS
jgi:hypothetical protein